jgi:hypothetical protein
VQKAGACSGFFSSVRDVQISPYGVAFDGRPSINGKIIRFLENYNSDFETVCNQMLSNETHRSDLREISPHKGK